MSTHNLCFGAKIRKIAIPLYTPVLLYKSGGSRGIHVTGHVFLMTAPDLNCFLKKQIHPDDVWHQHSPYRIH